MPTHPVFVVLEGLDGSGKSTCARALARALDAIPMTTPTPAIRRYRDDLIDQLGPSQEAHQLFYLATVFSASRQIRAHLHAGRSVVLDRYFLSTQAYAAFRGSALTLDPVAPVLRPADLTVFLDPPFDIRLARLHTRGLSAADRETLAPASDARLRHEHLSRRHLPVIGQFLHLTEPAPVEALVQQIEGALHGLPQPRSA